MQCDQSDIEPISLVRPYMSMAIMISRFGEVAEWSNVPDSKSGVGSNLPRVRIPPSPPNEPYLTKIGIYQPFIGLHAQQE